MLERMFDPNPLFGLFLQQLLQKIHRSGRQPVNLALLIRKEHLVVILRLKHGLSDEDCVRETAEPKDIALRVANSANPKSITQGSNPFRNIIFSGFRSRCTIPLFFICIIALGSKPAPRDSKSTASMNECAV